MLPVLLDLKFIKIYTFGVFLVLGFFWATFFLWKNIRLTSYREEEIFDGSFISLAGALFFGRLFYVLLNFKDFGFDILKFILINGYPGLSTYGFIFGFLLFLFIFSKSRKIPFREIIDYFVPSFFLAGFFVKLGGFLAGVEAGTVTGFFLKTRYSGFDGARHLTSLYESLLLLLGAYFSQKIILEIRKEKYFKGFLLYYFAWYFSAISFLFDKIKTNHIYFMGRSVNGMISLIILLTTGFYLLYHFRSPILNFFRLYGQKTFGKIHSGSKKQAGGGEKK